MSGIPGTGAVINSILIIEDDVDEAAFLKEFLESKGFTAITAKDGGQAQSAFVMRQPDFILLDLILPTESGFEICERFKQKKPDIPIVILSAIELDDSKHLAERVGADAYLEKPFDPDELVQTMLEIAEDYWSRLHLDTPTPATSGRVRFTCPSCGRKIKVKSVHRGRTMTCPDCREPVTVPHHD